MTTTNNIITPIIENIYELSKYVNVDALPDSISFDVCNNGISFGFSIICGNLINYWTPTGYIGDIQMNHGNEICDKLEWFVETCEEFGIETCEIAIFKTLE